jgi:DNA-binding CsgD family transcriptional regulator/tetratricopeptide (TPR) repeat protein
MELLEREDALAALARARREGGRVVLVAGEAGIGKTALLTTFAATQDGVLRGGCDALRTPRTLGPLRDIARTAGGDLARVMAADSARYDRFSAFLDVLAAGRTVVVEDVHWADEATLDLLVFAGRRVGATTGLLIVTYRDDELGPGHPLRGVLGSLAGEPSARRIRLRPLSPGAVARLARPYGVDPLEIHARTGGNPFFVTEVLADPGPSAPATVRDAVLARAGALDADARAALDAVAVVPDHTELFLLDGLETPGGGDARTAVDACVRAGMLVGEGAGVRFRHELARLTVEQAIPPARRTALHATVLARLASRTESDPARLAHHAEEAGDGPAVLAYAPVAAERATAAGAHRQAADQYERALRFAADLRGDEPADLREHAELLERHGVACAKVGRDTAALDSSGLALDLWRRIGDAGQEAALLALRSCYLWRASRSEDAHASVRAALAMLDPDRPRRPLAAAYTWSAFLLMLARDIPRAIEVGTRAVELTERLGEAPLLAQALNAVGSAQWFTEPERAEPTLLRGLEVARRAGDDGAAASALANLGSGAGEIRRYDVAERWLRECADWCEQRDLDGHRHYALAWLARVFFERGRWSAAAEVLVAEPPVRMAPSRIVALTALGRLRVRRGEPDAEQALDEAWDLAQRTMDLQRLWPVAAGRAELAHLSGRTAEIPALVTRTHEHAVRLGHRWAAGELGYWLHQAGGGGVAGDTPYALEATGDWAGAAAAWERLGCPYEAAVARAASPDVTEVLAALDRLQRLGARPAAELVARRLRGLGVDKRPRRATVSHPAGLTSRELEVLALLREGLRNADIAARLHIADRTAGHHVSAILAKLGVRSRAEAARWTDGMAAKDG